MSDTDMLYMASLQKRLADIEAENTELKARIAELEDKHWNECGQVAHYDDELRKAKELLKAAVEDFKVIGKVLDADCDILINCEECPLQSGHYNCRSWNHQDEALALIGKDTNVPASADDTNVGHKSGGWISCEDRLPIEQGPVLCYARSTTGEGNYRILGTLRNGEFWFLQVDGTQLSFPNLCLEVTHWMPLPEPPKE